ncbi:uncharacterized protein SCODWIG_01377 [Saccharomycodes ludwigii]|uniref:Uncharacterized protein n=1 Tax=Saccharomycodes ludwigii TaxID=36035 RepID=A0A376B4J8_9ASCO|nr:uncharacterized protein SCODWIG_01377 [Saccharomycodes ludwigii]
MSDINELVNLIELLYSPERPANFNDIQKHLLSIQKSPQGAHLANQLLSFSNSTNGPTLSSNVQYFAALTLTVQINHYFVNNSNNTGEEEQEREKFGLVILKDNLNHLITYILNYLNSQQQQTTSDNGLLVIKKLMSNLALIFMYINEKKLVWKNPIFTLIYLLQQNYNPNNDSIDNNNVLFQSLNVDISYEDLINFIKVGNVADNSNNKLLLFFTSIIVEELVKCQSSRSSFIKLANVFQVVHDSLYTCTFSIFAENLRCLLYNKGSKDLHAYLTDLLFRCISSWCDYVITISEHAGSDARIDLNNFFEILIQLLTNDTVDFQYTAEIIKILKDIITTSPYMLNYEIRTKLEVLLLPTNNADSWMLKYMNHCVTNELYEGPLKDLSTLLVTLLLVYVIRTCNRLFTNIPTDNNSQNKNELEVQEYIKVLLQLTNFPLIPVLQESFSVEMVDFWTDLAESYQSLPVDVYKEENIAIANDLFGQVISIYLPKLSLLNKQKILDYIDGDESEKHLLYSFNDFRDASKDLCDSLWSILGNKNLANVLIKTVIDSEDLFEIEVCCSLLVKLLKSMNLSMSPEICNELNSCNGKFVTNVLNLLTTGLTHPSLPLDFVRTGSDLLLSIYGFFNTDIGADKLDHVVQSLLQSMNYVTNNIENDTTSNIEILITRTITTLCENCRFRMHSYISTFAEILHLFLKPNSKHSPFILESFSRGYGALVSSVDVKKSESLQAIQERQYLFVNKFLDMVYECCTNAFNDNSNAAISGNNGSEAFRDYLLTLLKCINEFSTGFLFKEDDNAFYGYNTNGTNTNTTGGDDFTYDAANNSISFNDEDDDRETNAVLDLTATYVIPLTKFWIENSKPICGKVLALMNCIFTNYPRSNKDSEFIEVSCLIMGKNFSATTAVGGDKGIEDRNVFPFKFEIDEAMQFIETRIAQCEMSTCFAYIEYLIEVITRFLIYNKNLDVQKFDFILENFFYRYYQQYIVNDPDLIQHTCAYINSVLELIPDVVLHSKVMQTSFFQNFMELLGQLRETFSIKCITKFWVKILNNRKYNQEDSKYVQNLMTDGGLGINLTQKTLCGILLCKRSDLNLYCDLLRTIIAKYPLQSKKWLIHELSNDEQVLQLIPTTTISDTKHSTFIEKLMLSHNSRNTLNAVTEWWVACTGLPTY